MRIAVVVATVLPSLLASGADEGSQVTLYRFAKYRGSASKITIYCDNQFVTHLENKSYFSMHVSAGPHSFKDKKDDKRRVQPLEIVAVAGAHYFVQAEWVDESAFRGAVPHLTLTDPITINPFFRELKPLTGSLILSAQAGSTAPAEPRQWLNGVLTDIDHVTHPLPGGQTPDEEWIYTFKGERYTFVTSERTYGVAGFKHIGIAVGEEIKYSISDDALMVQDAAGRLRRVQLIKKILTK